MDQLHRTVVRAALVAPSIASPDPARRMGRAMRRVARSGPLNSLGLPWQPEQTWLCERCGESGPDRDDRPMSGCPKHPSARPSAPHLITFLPAEHHAAIRGPR
jgi:hypothetical protein